MPVQSSRTVPLPPSRGSLPSDGAAAVGRGGESSQLIERAGCRSSSEAAALTHPRR